MAAPFAHSLTSVIRRGRHVSVEGRPCISTAHHIRTLRIVNACRIEKGTLVSL